VEVALIQIQQLAAQRELTREQCPNPTFVSFSVRCTAAAAAAKCGGCNGCGGAGGGCSRGVVCCANFFRHSPKNTPEPVMPGTVGLGLL
jgi:hypothetical protein